MNAFEQLKEVIEDVRTRGGGYDAVVDAFSEIIAESDRLGDGWYTTDCHYGVVHDECESGYFRFWHPLPELPK